jgi:hypothetical protein
VDAKPEPTHDGQESRKTPRWRSQGLPLLGRAAKWVAVLAVVSLMVPALTTQWSDRQKELDLKTSLVSQITGSAATATQDAFTLVADEAKSSSIKDPAWRAQYRNILKEWRVAAFTLESELDAYFPRVELSNRQPSQPSRLVPAFALYNDIIQDYIRLSLDECRTNNGRRLAIARIYSYLGEDPPAAITGRPNTSIIHGPECWKKSESFRLGYQDLGDDLLKRRDILVDAVIHSNAAGYNVGFKDFVHQIVPFF